MSLIQFTMVEELAFLVKDNLPCKHLVLSIEEAFINFLQHDPSSDEVLELEPMNAYNRLLLHRLADIFGFSHQSVGEGDDRHLILERCPETSMIDYGNDRQILQQVVMSTSASCCIDRISMGQLPFMTCDSSLNSHV